MRVRAPLTAIVLGSIAIVTPGSAQVRASELGTVSQVVDGTRVTIEYSRPRARGRSPLFGTKIVRWNEVWTPGANFATTFNVTKDVELSGLKVPKGMYSVWMVVKQTGDWTMVLDPRARMFHEDHPDSTAAQIRFPVHVEQVTPSLEVLTWTFPEVRSTGATIAMQWGTYRASVHMTVQPSLTYTIASPDAEPYIGRYGGQEPNGSAPKEAWTLVVVYENGTLKAEYDPADNYFRRFALIRVGPDMFAPGIYDTTGQIYEVIRPDMLFAFTRKDGRVTGFEIRDGSDTLEAKGVRLP